MGSGEAAANEPDFPDVDAPVLAQVVDFLTATALDGDPPALEDLGTPSPATDAR